MPTRTEPYTIYDRSWIVRIQPPAEDGAPSEDGAAPPLLLLHGWTGDETVMWIFNSSFPANAWIFAPRGPVKAPESGYGWLPHGDQLPRLAEFDQVAPALLEAYQRWAADTHASQGPFDVMGFSQGAAMAYALAAYFPQRVNRIISLAGFLPLDDSTPGHYSALAGKKIYVAHGTQDDTIPVKFAQEAVRTLQGIGAQVTYCESDVGHKLSAGCLRGLDTFIHQ